jgi:hypothetical protein
MLSMLGESRLNQVSSDNAGGAGRGGVAGVALSEAAAAYRRAAGILEKAYGEDHEAGLTVCPQCTRYNTCIQL